MNVFGAGGDGGAGVRVFFRGVAAIAARVLRKSREFRIGLGGGG